jgi:hypothetical protein
MNHQAGLENTNTMITSTPKAVFNTVTAARLAHPNRGPKMISVWRQMADVWEAHPDLPVDIVALVLEYPTKDVVAELGVFAMGETVRQDMIRLLEAMDQDCF